MAKNRQPLCGEYIGIEATQSDFYGVFRLSYQAFAAEKPDLFSEHSWNQLQAYLDEFAFRRSPPDTSLHSRLSSVLMRNFRAGSSSEIFSIFL